MTREQERRRDLDFYPTLMWADLRLEYAEGDMVPFLGLSDSPRDDRQVHGGTAFQNFVNYQGPAGTCPALDLTPPQSVASSSCSSFSTVSTSHRGAPIGGAGASADGPSAQ